MYLRENTKLSTYRPYNTRKKNNYLLLLLVTELGSLAKGLKFLNILVVVFKWQRLPTLNSIPHMLQAVMTQHP